MRTSCSLNSVASATALIELARFEWEFVNSEKARKLPLGVYKLQE